MAAGGTKPPRSNPCSSSSASHSASSTSLLWPGRIFTCWALTSSRWKDRSSRTYQTGFQYEPVASIAMSVTPSVVNQSAISSSAPVNEANVRVSLRRPRPAVSGVRTQATTSFLPISIPAQRSISTSTTDLLVSIPTGQDRQGQPINDAVRRARGQQFEVPGRPLASVSETGSSAPSASELSRSHRDSHPSRRPETGHGFSELDAALAQPGQRIDLLAVDATDVHLEVQVRAGGLAAVAELGDLLAGLHRLTLLDEDLLHVAVDGHVAVLVLDVDREAVAAGRAGADD